MHGLFRVGGQANGAQELRVKPLFGVAAARGRDTNSPG
jgi:hypothetical protein